MKLSAKAKETTLRTLHNAQAQMWCGITERVRQLQKREQDRDMQATDIFLRGSIDALHADRDAVLAATKEVEKLETES